MPEQLFSTLNAGAMVLKNRVVMAPMTRSRSIGNTPDATVAEYYGQRSEAGLIITEGTSPSANGLGYARIPGLFNSEHVKGWTLVTQAVHKSGSKIFVQLMHCGRVSHPANMAKGSVILAPSALALTEGQMWTDASGMQPYPPPKEMSEAEIVSTIKEYVDSASLAMEAGFDGVEIHAANGYLIEQFLNTASNQRADKWGGSVENRTRFALEIAKGIVQKIGAQKVGMRISPFGVFNGMKPDAKTAELYETLSKELQKLGILYIHVVDHSSMGAPEVPASLKAAIRSAFRGLYILSGGYDLSRAEHDLREKRGDLVAFGRPFIANPRLVSKLKSGAALAKEDDSTLYTPGAKGYTDYPL